MGWMSGRQKKEGEKMLQSHMDMCRAMQRRHAMKKKCILVMHILTVRMYVVSKTLLPLDSHTCSHSRPIMR